MSKDEMIEIARQAGAHDNGYEVRFVEPKYLERFAKLVEERAAAKEREQDKPVALVTGVYGGRFTYAPIKASVVLTVGTALYTRPQPRKPLTDEQIDEIADTVANMPLVGIVNDFRTRFARAIEAAHGIKE